MTYLPLSATRRAELSDVKSIGLLKADGGRRERFLVAGAHVIFLDGDYRGQAFEQRAAQNWAGLAIEGLELEVDHDSVGFGNRTEAPLLSVVRRNAKAFVVGKLTNGGFGQRLGIDLGIDFPADDEGEVHFTRWRLILPDPVKKIEVFTFDTEDPARSAD
ncbi:MAG: hypothetical protein ACTHMG_04820 [Sphingomonas sp.]